MVRFRAANAGLRTHDTGGHTGQSTRVGTERRTGIADGEACELACGAVEVAAAVDEDLDEANRADGLVEERVVAAQVADQVARPRAHLALPVLQQRPHVLHQLCLNMHRRCERTGTQNGMLFDNRCPLSC